MVYEQYEELWQDAVAAQRKDFSLIKAGAIQWLYKQMERLAYEHTQNPR